ncbi:MAG: hypothetical protein COA58_03360 [Bacteroidetes bacterium]|nr:MAG: hypothetical protein COA58_03360 [Bacteroidota bacterium]
MHKLSSADIRIRKSETLKNGKNAIYIRFHCDTKYNYHPTGLFIELKYWDTKTSLVKKTCREYISINNQIRMWISKSQNVLLESPFIDYGTFLERLLETEKKKPETFLAIFQEYIQDAKADPDITNGTVINYQKVYNKCLSIWNSSMLIIDIDQYEIRRYIRHYREYGNKINYLNRNVKCIKTVLGYALSLDIEVRTSALKYKLSNTKTQRTHLSSEEVNRLEAYYEHTSSDKIKKVLKLYLFGCYTGLRYSDIVQLRPSDIVNGMILKKVQKSTEDKYTRIPLIPKAKAMVQDFPYFAAISNQKCNKYLKDVALLLSIDKRITFHTSRHTFATLALNYGIPIEVVSEVLSHTRIATTQIYAKMLNDTITDQMEKFKL